MNIIRAQTVSAEDGYERITDRKLLEESYAGFQSDESKFKGDVPLSLSFPTSVGHIVDILTKHHNAGEATSISGTRSGVVGASVPVGKTHSVSLEKLTGFEELGYDEREQCWFLRVKAGTTLSAIQAYLNEHKPEVYYPVDPTYQHAAIGGNVGTNASGMRTYYYGSTRSWVRALTVVLSDGKVVHLKRDEVRALRGELVLETEEGKRALDVPPIRVPKTKHSIGYHFDEAIDPIDILIASEGTLGVFAEVEIKLAPRPRERLYYVQFFRTDDQAFEFAARAQKLGLQLLAVEFFDKNSIEIASTHTARATSKTLQMLKPEYGGGVFLDVILQNPDSLEACEQQLTQLVKEIEGNAEDSIAGIDERDLADFKVFRHAIPEMINQTVAKRKQSIPRLHKISTDMAVDPTQLRELYRFYKETFTKIGIDYFIFGHFGSGHLHVNVVPKTEAELDSFLAIYPEIGRKIVALGGSVAGEHGIGRLKKQFMPIQYSEDELKSMRAIKRFFDPKWLLNRGVLIDEE